MAYLSYLRFAKTERVMSRLCLSDWLREVTWQTHFLWASPSQPFYLASNLLRLGQDEEVKMVRPTRRRYFPHVTFLKRGEAERWSRNEQIFVTFDSNSTSEKLGCKYTCTHIYILTWGWQTMIPGDSVVQSHTHATTRNNAYLLPTPRLVQFIQFNCRQSHM